MRDEESENFEVKSGSCAKEFIFFFLFIFMVQIKITT